MAKDRFRGFVELSGTDQPYISKAEERRLLEQGMSQFDLEPEEARGILLDVAQNRDLRLERDIDRRILTVLESYGGRRRRISRRKFRRAAALYRTLSGDAVSKKEARIKVKEVMERNKLAPSRGGLTYSRRWYNRIGGTERNRWLPPLLGRDI